MRVALIVNAFPTLSETFIFNKALRLRERGVDVQVIAAQASTDRDLFADKLGAHSIDFVQRSPIGTSAVMRPLAVITLVVRDFPSAVRLWRDTSGRGDIKRRIRLWLRAAPLRFGRFDIVHFEYTGIAVEHLDVFPLLRPARFVVSCRGAPEQIRPLMDPARPRQLRELFAAADSVHCVSHDMARTMARYGLRDDQFFVNHPSVDPLSFDARCRSEAPAPPYRIATVARLHWKKGLEYGLIAVRRLLDEGFDVRYDIIGGGPDEEHLRFSIEDLGLGSRVTLRGRRSPSDVRKLLSSCHVFMLPSLSEGVSNAALEAMSMAIPVVSTNAGGMDEAIVDGRDGYLVPSRNGDELSRRVASLLSDAALRSSIGEAGRRRVLEHFNVDRQADVFLEEYGDLLKTDR